MQAILPGIEFVVKHARSVSIDESRLYECARSFIPQEVKSWDEFLPFPAKIFSFKEKIAFSFVLHTISFSFWGDPKWRIGYNGAEFDGFFGMVAALYRAIDEDYPIFDSDFLSSISENDFSHIVRGNTIIPLFYDRLHALQELGSVIENDFQGSFVKMIDGAEHNTEKLLDSLVTHFSSFRDFAHYQGQEVGFYKRAQLLISDIENMYTHDKEIKFTRKEILTASADYKIPQILRKLGILIYTPNLAQKIQEKREIPPGSEEEIEIRAGMIWAVELLKQIISKEYVSVTSTMIGHYLWMISQDQLSALDEPYHRTHTIAY